MEPDGNVIVSVSGLEKSFGEIIAVDHLSFDIFRGETFGLLGPNGAGKTTTISMLVGLLEPDQGTVRIGNGQQADPLDPSVRGTIGIAPQSVSLYGELTAHENLSFFGQLYGLAGKRLHDQVDWALEFAGLTDRQRDRVGTFSGGMRRRLNIAVALIHRPSVLLLDEPTVGVDPHSRNHIYECIAQLKQDGITILYTTHYMEEAQRLCDRVAIVDHGKLMALDTVDGLIAGHGGQSVVHADIKQDAGNLSIPDNVELPGRLDNGKLRFESDNPLENVAELSGHGVQFQTLRITQPDLESVFLSLTGRSLHN